MVIKPDAVQAGKVDEIVEKVQSQGMEILAKEEHQFTKEEAAEFYKQHEGSVSCPSLSIVYIFLLLFPSSSPLFLPATSSLPPSSSILRLLSLLPPLPSPSPFPGL